MFCLPTILFTYTKPVYRQCCNTPWRKFPNFFGFHPAKIEQDTGETLNWCHPKFSFFTSLQPHPTLLNTSNKSTKSVCFHCCSISWRQFTNILGFHPAKIEQDTGETMNWCHPKFLFFTILQAHPTFLYTSNNSINSVLVFNLQLLAG